MICFVFMKSKSRLSWTLESHIIEIKNEQRTDFWLLSNKTIHILKVLKQRKVVKPANSGDESSGRSSPVITSTKLQAKPLLN